MVGAIGKWDIVTHPVGDGSLLRLARLSASSIRAARSDFSFPAHRFGSA